MQKVIYKDSMAEYSEFFGEQMIEYFKDEQIETYESFDKYDLIAFDWYDINNYECSPAQIIIYIDKNELFFICENDVSYKIACKMFVGDESNERALYLFFRNLFRGSTKHLEEMENKITLLEDDVTDGTEEGLRENLINMRNKVLNVKKYYEQLGFLFDEICENDNSLISADYLRYFEILRNRSVRLVSQALNLREYIAQVEDLYQSQIGIEQNNLMRVFTMVTSIFLPLTLIVGWYGMNLKMPEFKWSFGYPFVAVLSVVVCTVWIIVFKKNKWLK